jgi:hypothetical protein
MRLFLATCLTSLFIAGAALAGGGNFDDQQQEQYAMPQTKVVVVPADNGGNDSTALIWVAVVGAVGTLGAAVITTRNRKG